MIGIVKHIEEFSDLLKSKGYTDTFMANGHSGKLEEAIERHILECYRTNQPLNPIHLRTYTKWNGEEKPHVRCDFIVNYDKEKHFEVKALYIHYGDMYGKIRESELRFSNNSEVPDQKKANEISNDQKRKGLRF